jgi:hypothetical protein
MAGQSARLLKIGLLTALVIVATAGGCGPRAGMVENLPSPSFDGPNIVALGLPAPNTPSQWNAPSQSVPGGFGSERAWVPAVPARQWKWIVIHHSATPSGSAAVFDKMHRQKGWDELGYHFVIGNGTDSGNGQIEVGSRWPKQKWGAHAKTADNRFNDYGIGICLVGNFDVERPTQQQLRSLARLTAYLMRTYHIPPDRVLGHRDTKPTDCPGRNLNIAAVRRTATQMLASADAENVTDTRTASARSISVPSD